MPLHSSHIDDTFTSKEEGIKKLLSGILTLNLQHELSEKYIISIINRLLSTAKHRKEGLEYLSIVIGNCSSSIVAENAINWTGHCIIKYSSDILRELKLSLLGEIIEVAHNESEFNKKFVSDYISKVLDNCTATSHTNPYVCKAALKTLSISMQNYPSWFGAHMQKIEKFLLLFLDSDNAALVQNAALVFHYLQQIGGAGANSVNHKLNFTQNFNKLCKTIHKLYDNFFENEEEMFHTERFSDDNVFEFQDNPSSNNEVLLHINARRIRNVLIFIETMIKTKFPVAKETKPKELLEVITRGTSFHKCISGDSIESLETYQFSFLLSEIQCAVLKLLRLFIIWYQTNCLPFSYSISKILVDSIERSHNCGCFKYDSLYQESSYRALSEWLSISKSSLHSQFQSRLLICILKDITPVKTQITLTISEAASGKKSQKAKRKAMADRIISSANQSFSNDTSTHYEKQNEKNTCKFALTALRHLLELTSLNVKATLLKDLYKSIFESLTTIQAFKILHPYADAQCQVKLYEVLVAIYNQHTLSILPPLQTSLDILTRGSNDNNRFVSETCQKGLRTLEMLCQPICPSLYLKEDQEVEENMEEAEGVREVVQIEEMDDDEEGLGYRASSVDYDASTDECSRDVSFMQNTCFSDVAYEVEQPDTDDGPLSDKDTEEFSANIFVKRATSFVNETEQPDDDKGAPDRIVGFGEIDSSNRIEEEADKPEDTTVIILSDDENEVVVSETHESEESQSVKEYKIEPACPSDSQQKNEDGITIEELIINPEIEESNGNMNEKESVDKEQCIETDKVDLTESRQDSDEPTAKKAKLVAGDVLDMGDEFDDKKGKTEEKEPDSIDLEDDCFVDEKNEDGITIEELIINPEIEESNGNMNEKEAVDKEQCIETDKVDSTESRQDSDEPAAKKAKLVTGDVLDMGDEFDDEKGKTEEKEPDSIDLEDDCFVDEVKNYY